MAVIGLEDRWPSGLVTTFSCSRSQCFRERMRDTPAPPPLPQNALIWIVVAALVLVLVRAAWRGLLGPRCCACLPQERQTTDLLAVTTTARQEAHA